MTPKPAIPMPPFELREMVGPPELEFFDNPTGKTLYPELPAEVYDSIFDFGCGCGRVARLLLQQKQPPVRRYVGIDVHRQMIEWCANNLSPVAPYFKFYHHDVWSPGYGRGNSPKLAEPFPVEDNAFSLFIANSVFTHVYKEQAEYYLCELSRILKPQGIAMTSWFFFDNESFPFQRGGVPCLFTSEIDTTSAVIYDRRWFISMLRRCGLAVRKTTHPPVAGHQWWLELEKRTPASVDAFPLGEDQAEWLCGTTVKPIGKPSISAEETEKHRVGHAPDADSTPHASTPPPPLLRGLHADLTAAQAELARIKGSWVWKLARTVIKPARALMRFLRN